MKSNLKKSVTAFIIGIIMSIGVMSAFAYQQTVSIEGFYQQPVLGHYYGNKADCTDWGQGIGVQANATMFEANSNNVPSGYMGAQAWLFKDNVLYSSSSWQYNSSSTWFQVAHGSDVYISGYYKAGGRTGAYNGTDYTTCDTFISPVLYYQN